VPVQIFTASWFTPLPPDVQRIGISRGTPRGMPGGYRKMAELNPGSWFMSARPSEYYERYYGEILRPLDLAQVLDRFDQLASGKPAVALLCYERPPFVAETYNLCHRRIVASWIEQHTGTEVAEFLPDGVALGDTVPLGAGIDEWLEIAARVRPKPQRRADKPRGLF